jgi:hypothetical protein
MTSIKNFFKSGKNSSLSDILSGFRETEGRLVDFLLSTQDKIIEEQLNLEFLENEIASLKSEAAQAEAALFQIQKILGE